MLSFDTILLIVLAVFTLMGFWRGFIRTLGSVVGVFIGVFVASHFYEQGAQYARFLFLAPFAKFASFTVIFLVVTKLVSLVFWILNASLKILSIIPFVKTFNRLLGAVLGFLEGALILGVILSFIGKLTLFPDIGRTLNSSTLTPPLIFLAQITIPLFPEALRNVKVLF